MKDMIKKVREERGGFTLAELLIVVAIIMVLVAIAVPVFSGAMEQANTAVAQGDIRAVKGAAATKYLLDGKAGTADEVLTYTGTVTRDGDITEVVEADGASDTDPDDVVEWLADKTSGDEFNITVTLTETDLDG